MKKIEVEVAVTLKRKLGIDVKSAVSSSDVFKELQPLYSVLESFYVGCCFSQIIFCSHCSLSSHQPLHGSQ